MRGNEPVYSGFIDVNKTLYDGKKYYVVVSDIDTALNEHVFTSFVEARKHANKVLKLR